MSLTVTWYGHAAFGLEIEGVQVLIDPFLRDNPAAAIQPEEVDPAFILVSHGHADHLGDTVEIATRTGATVVANAEISAWLRRQGVETHAQHIGGGHQYPFGYLKLTQALHGSGLPDGSYGGNPAGFLLTATKGERIYFACDTGLFGDMRLIGEEGVDLALLPIGDNYTMGPDDALRAVRLIEPKHVIPFHFNTWDVIAQDPRAWAAQVARETQAAPHVLQPGESFQL
jgi:L-ascorbate metabolism protein UlaG (beta-lactamase superfamily)